MPVLPQRTMTPLILRLWKRPLLQSLYLWQPHFLLQPPSLQSPQEGHQGWYLSHQSFSEGPPRWHVSATHLWCAPWCLYFTQDSLPLNFCCTLNSLPAVVLPVWMCPLPSIKLFMLDYLGFLRDTFLLFLIIYFYTCVFIYILLLFCFALHPMFTLPPTPDKLSGVSFWFCPPSFVFPPSPTDVR